MVLSESQDGLIFVFGQHGKKLAEMDKDRVLAIGQKDCDYYLSTMYNEDLMEIIKEIDNLEGELTNEIEDKIKDLNKKDTIFRETQKFLMESQDNLSIGSLLVGETDKSGRFASIVKTKKENDLNE